MKKILVMGLPNAGKTTMARALMKQLKQHNKTVNWFNADRVREDFNDWDFSDKGRLRQAARMFYLARDSKTDYVICDFVCPTKLAYALFEPQHIIWMDTINQSKYEDTNQIFTPPTQYDFRVTEKDAVKYAEDIARKIINGSI